MTEKLYYWAENLDGYSSDNEQYYDQIIEIKRLNFFIGKNNAGKSRFLRELFKNKNGQQLYNSLQYRKLMVFKQKLTSSQEYPLNSNYNHFLTTVAQLNPTNIGSAKNIFSQALEYLSRFNQLQYLYPNNNKPMALDLFSKEIEQNLNPIFTNFKFYIPILRGMRPVTDQENKQPYIERAQKDYFSDTTKFNSKNIITGECLYHELKIHLLGEPEQRDLIKNYEKKLSQYFFDNEPVSLIPKHDQDVVNIKIGADRQFPISDLGDGLQQAIILTYEAYIKSKNKAGKDEIHAFFIEEPELHMHAGMVRQLMNFYLNETKHYYFFTTHSNHLLDMADESDQVIIQKFVKQAKQDDEKQFEFKIYRCDRDRDLLASLGVKPSSVYLANCTIWVEGITDRLYITKYMEKYLSELKESNLELFKKYRRFMPNYHYTFVEYAGSNLVHWSFSDEFAEHLSDQGMNALLTTSSVLLIADGDIQTKGSRVEQLSETLGEKFVLLKCKETENTLSSNLISMACHIKFSGLNKALENDSSLKLKLNDYLSIDGMQASTKEGFDINYLNEDVNFFHAKDGIGKIIDTKIKVGNPRTTDNKQKKCFSDSSGTIKEKLKFCRLILTLMEHLDWELTDSAKDICEKVFAHIEKCNS